MKKKRRLIILGIIAAALFVIALFAYFMINSIVINDTDQYIYDIGSIDSLEKADCVLVPGALVYDDESLSLILKDRVDYAIAIYEAGKAGKLLFSGDHGQTDYDEVNAMMDYAIAQGVPEEDIFLDHAGFSTYESLYRARDIFCVSDVIIVTQAFHLPRAVYVARALGLDAAGVNSDPREYANATYDAVRESLARVKDFFYVNVFLPEPTYLGDTIPIYGSSDETHDKG
ncbi:MAG: ElyC/SanA/YdcF family protein [Eubacteriales bacterium]|nr:ElyC/SanA/YdcF family protein [Eubacteriales bacterium]